MSDVKLNHMQQVSVEKFTEWYRYPQKRKRDWFEISGPAGSGKTTTIKEMIKNVGLTYSQVSFMAFVGKATLAMRLAGVPAKTIHNTIYELVYKKKDDDSIIKQFVKKQNMGDISLFSLDEGGMVGSVLAKDILSFKIPMMVSGDLNQLPPVMDKRFFLSDPDVILNEIMRQQKDSQIILLSQYAIHGIGIPYGIYGNGECIVIKRKELTDELLKEADVVICESNKMRDNINLYIRTHIYNINNKNIVKNDKLICRQNKWDILLDEDIALVNGLSGYVKEIYEEPISSQVLMQIDFRPEFYEDKYFKDLPFDHKFPFLPYEKRKSVLGSRIPSESIKFEFGYAITCHLSQGSQYDTVIVYVENYNTKGLYFRQWLYTAITRAKKKLILVI